MAKFNEVGLEDLQLSLEELAKIPDDVVEQMLLAGAEVTAKAHKQKLTSLGLFNPRSNALKHLVDSIKIFSKVRTKNGVRQRYVLVYPQGKHHSYTALLRTKFRGIVNTGRTATATAGDVGFVLEYGAKDRGIKSYQWMRKANEESAAAVEAAEMEVYDRWLDSLGL